MDCPTLCSSNSEPSAAPNPLAISDNLITAISATQDDSGESLSPDEAPPTVPTMPIVPPPTIAPPARKPEIPGGPLPTPDEQIKRKAHRRRRNVPSEAELQARAAAIAIPGLEVLPATVVKGTSSSQGRYLVNNRCAACSHEMQQVLTALEQGTRKKCRCHGGVRNHPKHGTAEL